MQVVPRLEKSDASVATSQYLRCMGNCTLKPVLQEAKNGLNAALHMFNNSEL